MERMRGDAAVELLRALRTRAERVQTMLRLEELASRGWASVTFTGARHRLAFRLEGAQAEAAADRFLAGLEEAEFTLRGHILADISLLSRGSAPGAARIEIEALTVEDC